MTNKKPYSRNAKGVLEENPTITPFDEAADFTIDSVTEYQNRDNTQGFAVKEVKTPELPSLTPSEEEIAQEGGSIGGVPLDGTTAPSFAGGVQYTAKHAKRERKGLLEPNDNSYEYEPDTAGIDNPLNKIPKERDEEMHMTDKKMIVQKWFGWLNEQHIAKMGVYMHDNITMTDWVGTTMIDKPAVYNGWIEDFMGYSNLMTKISEPEEVVEDMWKTNVIVKGISVPVYIPAEGKMIESEVKEWSYQCVFEFTLPEGDNYPKVIKITRKKNK